MTWLNCLLKPYNLIQERRENRVILREGSYPTGKGALLEECLYKVIRIMQILHRPLVQC